MLYIWGKSKFKADNQKDAWHDDDEGTLHTAEILSGKNARAWVSLVSIFTQIGMDWLCYLAGNF